MTEDKVPEIFVDGLGMNRFSRGVIRLDLISTSEMLDPDDPDMSSEVTHRLIMAPQGFAQMVYVLNGLLRQLIEAGVVPQNPDQAGMGANAQNKPAPKRKAATKKRK